MIMTLRNVVVGHFRIFIGLCVVALAFALFPAGVAIETRAIVAWDIGVLSFFLMTLHLFLTRDATQMAALAETQEDGQWTIFWVALAATVVSFAAVITEFAGLKELPNQERAFRVTLVAVTLMMSWLLAHVLFAVRYAHEWYDGDSDGGLRKGLDFPDDTQPDYMDFLYFSIVLGMTFQVSDVQISARRLRRLALLHGLLSFLFNTLIVAMTVNIAAGLL